MRGLVSPASHPGDYLFALLDPIRESLVSHYQRAERVDMVNYGQTPARQRGLTPAKLQRVQEESDSARGPNLKLLLLQNGFPEVHHRPHRRLLPRIAIVGQP